MLEHVGSPLAQVLRLHEAARQQETRWHCRSCFGHLPRICRMARILSWVHDILFLWILDGLPQSDRQSCFGANIRRMVPRHHLKCRNPTVLLLELRLLQPRILASISRKISSNLRRHVLLPSRFHDRNDAHNDCSKTQTTKTRQIVDFIKER